ncbi:MAG: hypothetical protein JST86_17275 [Bacteroidetes bacterium]|nr:hypothetical protein [Bacteroidota bacterium]
MQKLMIRLCIAVAILLIVVQSHAQINKMNRPVQNQTSIKNMTQPVNNNPPAGTATDKMKDNNRIQQLMGRPMPKKIQFFSKARELNLRSERTLSNSIAGKVYSAGMSKPAASTALSMPPKNTGSSNVSSQMTKGYMYEEMTTLGVNTRKYADGHKASFVLTTQTNGWTVNPSYVIKGNTPSNDNSDPSWNCTTTVETVNAQSTSFMNASKNEQGQHLYPGAIYSYDDYAAGTFRVIENNLNPMQIYTSTSVGNNSFTVDNPTGSSIHQAISNIVRQFSPQQGGAAILQQTLYSDNQSDMAIAISAGGAYDGYSGADNFNHNQLEHHIYITLDAMKSLYTISAQRPANGYFINGQIPAANSALVMVQDVTYGARLLANIDITITSKTDMNKFQFAYNAIAANGFVNVDALTHDASITYKINAYMVGVPASTGIITTLQNFEQQLNNIFSQSNYTNAVPIQYALTDMDGNYLGVESMTDKFPVRNCTPANEYFMLQSAYIKTVTGSDNKNGDSFLEYMLNGSNSMIAFVAEQDGDEYKSGSSHTVKFTNFVDVTPQDHPHGFTLDDFNNGGSVTLRLSYGVVAFRTGDDWDVGSTQLTLNFTSQKGTQLTKVVNWSNAFRITSGNGHPDPADKTIYFDANFQGL